MLFRSYTNYPDLCNGCQHKGKIGSPISLGKTFTAAQTSDSQEPIRADKDSEKVPDFPQFLMPYMRGEAGGLYYQPPPKIDKKGNKTEFELELILPYDFYAIRRMVSKHDGECLLMKLVLPKDPSREVLIQIGRAHV